MKEVNQKWEEEEQDEPKEQGQESLEDAKRRDEKAQR